MGLLHTRSARPSGRPPGAESPAAGGCRMVDWRASLRRAEHACCCPAKPAVVVIMPPAPGRPYPVDLLLCAHHYRACEHALTAAGAEVFDTHGAPLSPDRFELALSG